MRLTEEMILRGLTGGIGINNAQANLLGINIKKSGWKRILMSMDIPEENYIKFLELKGVRGKSKKSFLIKKNSLKLKFEKQRKLIPTGVRWSKEDLIDKEVHYQVQENGTLKVILIK